MAKYVVKENQRVSHGVPGQKPRTYTGGDVIELDPEQAAAMPWAVEPVDNKQGTKTK